ACVAGSGPDELSSPTGVAVDSGKIYVADEDNHRVQIFDSSGVYQKTIGVTGVPGSDQLHFKFPAGVAVDSSGNIYVADADNHRVQIFDSSGNWKKTIGETGVPGIEQFHFNFPTGVTVDSSGNIIVGDSFNYRVQIFSALSISNGDGADSLSDPNDDPVRSKIKP